MSQTKQINTNTILNSIGSLIGIFTYYIISELPNIISIFISEVVGILNGINYTEGELVIIMKNNPQDIDFYLNSLGNLIVLADDSSNYSINGDGDLIYTT